MKNFESQPINLLELPSSMVFCDQLMPTHSTEELQLEESLVDCRVVDAVKDEALRISEAGLAKVSVMDVKDPKSIGDMAKKADEMTEFLVEQKKEIAYKWGKEYADDNNPMYEIPGLRAWGSLSLGTGLGIYTLYIADQAKTLGEGIDPSAFDEPIFDYDGSKKISAKEYVEITKSPEEAKNILDSHLDFIKTPIEVPGDDVSRFMLCGTEDSVGIRVRSELARDMAVDSLKDHDKTKPLEIASIGAGSAIPILKTVQALMRDGHDLRELHLIDMDPMALAVAYSILTNAGLDRTKIKLHIETVDVRHGKIGSLNNNSMDYVEAWGFLEYFRQQSATGLARAVKDVLKSGGVFAFGNMLSERAQNEYFNDVVKWTPKVTQRSLHQGVDILDKAGFAQREVVIPTTNSVYVGYQAIKS